MTDLPTDAAPPGPPPRPSSTTSSGSAGSFGPETPAVPAPTPVATAPGGGSPTLSGLPQAAGPPSGLPQASGPSAGQTGPAQGTCPACGTENEAGATFCEACGAGIAPGSPASGGTVGSPPAGGRADAGGVATPQTAPAGEESPLDVGWTGVVATGTAPSAPDLTCTACGLGQIVDGYCDHCGTPPPDPRNHVVDAPATWVGGVCDIGRRHSRNEDAMSLSASEPPGSRAVLVVCDGVSMATDSHIASLAAAKAARAVLDQPFPQGVGTPEAWAAGVGRALTTAVTVANAAVAATVTVEVPNPPSCTFAAAVVEHDVIVAANVGDSRVYWLPDSVTEPARQLGADDSYAQEQIDGGMTREEAETGPQAHSITRWLGQDSPDDLTPHLTTVVSTPGWLMVCSDGLWNYCSEPDELRARLHSAIEGRDGPDGLDGLDGSNDPAQLAQQLVDFANEQGGRDNITVALARLAGQGSNATSGVAFATAPATPEEEEATRG